MLTIKKVLISFALFMVLPMMAQVDNAQQNVSVTDLTYMIKEGPKSEWMPYALQ